MAQRLIVAAVGIPLILVVFLWLPPVWSVIMFAALGAIGAYELLWSTSFVRNVRITVLSCVLAVMIPFHYFSGGSEEVLLSGIFCYVVLIFCEALISHYQITFEKLGIAIFGAVIIPYFLSAFVRIRAVEGEHGIYYILLPLVCSFASDAFALFAGLAWGKHKLAPDLSPKKTVEGAVGGLLGAVICCLIYGLIMQFGVKLRVNYFTLIVYGALGSLIAQIGDLSFSYIKRQTGLKDFGTIFPGHGGVLDRFDSVIFCAPLIEILIWLLPAFV